jgi:hypothetical protein
MADELWNARNRKVSILNNVSNATHMYYITVRIMLRMTSDTITRQMK